MKKISSVDKIFVAVMVLLIGGICFANANENKQAKEKKPATIPVVASKVANAALPDNIKDLIVLEDKLTAELREVSQNLYTVLNKIRLEQGKVKKTDPEIKAIYVKINKLKLQAEELTLKKNPEVKKLAGEREKLVKQYNDLQQKMLDVKSEKAKLMKK